MNAQKPTTTTRLAALFNIAARGQTYRAMLYLLTAVPLGLGYLLLLLIGLVLDLLRFGVRGLMIAVGMVLYAGFWLLLWIGWLLLLIGRVIVIGGARVLVGSGRALMATPRSIGRLAGRERRDVEPRRVVYPEEAPITTRIVERKALPAYRLGPDTVKLRQPIDWRFSRRPTVLGRVKPRSAFGSWTVVAALCWLLAGFERNHAVRWLHIHLPPVTRPPRTAAQSFPWTILVYLLATAPIGIIGSTLIVLGGLGAGTLLLLSLVSLFDRHVDSDIPLAEPLLFLLGIGVGLATLYTTMGVVHLWGRFGNAMLGANDTIRRLRDAEARAAHDRAKAEQAERSRRDLIINVSHELRTPTASIRGHVESLLLALDQPNTPPIAAHTLKQYLDIVVREADRLSTLVDELLSLARAETNELHLQIVPVDGAAVIEEVHQALAPLARRERQVTVVQQIEPHTPLLLADRQRLLQVLLNLVRNAITYTPPGGIVSITLHQALTSDQIVLAVADTGSGISPGELDRIWERFYRTDASRARSSGGFGLGLAIARELIEAMHGTINVQSTLGEGSYFEVRLPIAQITSVGAPLVGAHGWGRGTHER